MCYFASTEVSIRNAPLIVSIPKREKLFSTLNYLAHSAKLARHPLEFGENACYSDRIPVKLPVKFV